MTNENAKKLASELLSLTRNMLEMAQNELWDEMEGMDKQRGTLLKQLFSATDPVESIDDGFLEMLRDVQVGGDLLMTLVSNERDRLGEELRNLQSGRKAQSVYETHIAYAAAG